MQTLRLGILGVAMLYVQLLVMPHLSLWHAMPNLLLAWVLLAGVKLPRAGVLVLAFLLGLAYDLTLPLSLGMHATIMLLSAEAVSRLHNSWSKSSPVNVLLAVFLLTVGWELGQLLFMLFTGHGAPLSVARFTGGLGWQTVSGTIALYALVLLDRVRLHVEV